MGLDQYARTRRSKPAHEVDFDTPAEEEINNELFYWRKHPDLHGWMQRLAVEKGFDADPAVFNCVSVLLTGEDLNRLERDIRNQRLPSTDGFFFGMSDPSRIEHDMEFVKKAREALDRGEFVYYSSWW